MMKSTVKYYLIVAALVVSACSGVSPEEAATEVKEAKAWYCGTGMMGIRAVARFVIFAVTGASVPNACKVVDAVIEADQ
jgi:hypothetical protein